MIPMMNVQGGIEKKKFLKKEKKGLIITKIQYPHQIKNRKEKKRRREKKKKIPTNNECTRRG